MSAYAPRHAPSPRLTPILLAGLDAAVLAVAILAVLLSVLALSRAPGVTTASPLPPASTSAPVHATPATPAPHRAAQPRAAAPLPYTVQKGDSLWSISAWYYGSSMHWHQIWVANRTVIGPDPGVIQPGQQLTFPRQ